MIRRVLPGSRRLDLVVLGCALALSALGILFIDSATTGTRYQGLASRQAIWIAVGLGAMIVAILSDQPVQIIDLPDVPVTMMGQAEALSYLAKSAKELRLPQSGRGLQEARWSFDAKYYAIR